MAVNGRPMPLGRSNRGIGCVGHDQIPHSEEQRRAGHGGARSPPGHHLKNRHRCHHTAYRQPFGLRHRLSVGKGYRSAKVSLTASENLTTSSANSSSVALKGGAMIAVSPKPPPALPAQG